MIWRRRRGLDLCDDDVRFLESYSLGNSSLPSLHHIPHSSMSRLPKQLAFMSQLPCETPRVEQDMQLACHHYLAQVSRL